VSVGIIIPDTAKEKPAVRGRVIAVGRGAINDKSAGVPLDVKERRDGARRQSYSRLGDSRIDGR
jgi:co-chaperonin GroES (HSP10)